ncbi:MAG: hypothetical protein ABJA90_06970 [Ginsengibacter sp.]
MKSIIISFLIVSLFSCTDTSNSPDMPGTYLMKSQTLYDGTKDTKLNSLKQLKIYTDSFFMYSQVNPADSVSAFGVGSYTPGKESVTENVIYSASDSTLGKPISYKLEIEKDQDGYKQVIPEIVVQGEKSKLTEEYQEVGHSAKTPLDGLWKEVKSYNIRGKDTIMNVRTQYKTYYDGYFMFGHTVKDSTSKTIVGIGFGTFEMKSDNQIKETDLNSTYSIIAGNTFDVDVEMESPDKYRQMIHNADGTIGVEYYERLKKQ